MPAPRLCPSNGARPFHGSVIHQRHAIILKERLIDRDVYKCFLYKRDAPLVGRTSLRHPQIDNCRRSENGVSHSRRYNEPEYCGRLRAAGAPILEPTHDGGADDGGDPCGSSYFTFPAFSVPP